LRWHIPVIPAYGRRRIRWRWADKGSRPVGAKGSETFLVVSKKAGMVVHICNPNYVK
jgi:hypothetical protein